MDKKQELKNRFIHRMTKYNLLTILLRNLDVGLCAIELHVSELDHDFFLLKKYLAMYDMTKKRKKKNER